MLHSLRNRPAGRLARIIAVCGLALAFPLAAQDAEETNEEVPFLFEESDPAEYDLDPLDPLDDYWLVELTEVDGEKVSACFEKKPTPLADAGLPSGYCSGDCSAVGHTIDKSRKYNKQCDPEKERIDDVHPDCPITTLHKLCFKARDAAWRDAEAKCKKNGGKRCVCWPSKIDIIPKSRCKESAWNYCKWDCYYVIKGNCDLYPKK